MSGARAFAWLGLGHASRWLQEIWQLLKQTSLHPALEASQHACTPHEWSPGFHSPPVNPTSTPVRQGTFSPKHRTPRLGLQICGSHHSLPRVGIPPMHSHFHSESPPRGTGPDLITFFPFLPNYMCIFFTALVVQESFCQFLVSFQ